MAFSKRTANEAGSLTISELLNTRALRFTLSTAIVMLVTLALVASYILSVEFSRARSSTQAWVEGNKQRIEQALFLENTLAIRGLLFESNNLRIGDGQTMTGLLITDVKGNNVAALGSLQTKRPASRNVYSILTGHMTTTATLEFAERPEGQMVIESAIDRSALFESAFIALLIMMTVIVAIGLAARSLIKELRSKVLGPLTVMIEAITAPDAATRNLEGLALHESEVESSAVEIQRLFASHKKLLLEIGKLNAQERKHAELANKIKLATQVSHDIRSPLSALRMVLGVTAGLNPDERSLIQASVDRINSIADNLLSKSRLESAEASAGSFDLQRAIEELMIEKKLEFAEREISWQLNLPAVADTPFVRGDADQFKTVVSNLINNSVDAIRGSGTISVTYKFSDTAASIEISDNGCGIPPEIAARLGRVPVTHGKTSGNGIGVFSARQTLETFGATLKINSQVGVGTTVAVELRVKLEEMMLSEIKIGQRERVVIVDDDANIAAAWRLTLPATILVDSFTEPSQFEKFMQANVQSSDTLFLIDQEFENSSETGIDLITRLQLQERAVLVTGRAQDPSVRASALRNRIRVMSKSDISQNLVN